MTTFNVLRYSALGAGILYGINHKLGLKSQHEKKVKDEKFHKTEKLIAEAKEEYSKLNSKKTDSSPTKIDLNDNNLDFAKVILGAVENLK